jgi:hypothetical protein
VAEAPSRLDSAVPAMVVIGFGLLFAAIVAGAAFQLRRASRNPRRARDEPETGVLDAVDSGGT